MTYLKQNKEMLKEKGYVIPGLYDWTGKVQSGEQIECQDFI